MANNKILKNSLKDREYNWYIWINWGVAKMVFSVSWIQQVELVLQEKFSTWIAWEFYLPGVPYWQVSFHWIDWNWEFWNQTILTNLVSDSNSIVNNWDYFINQANWKVVYRANWTGMLWVIFLTSVNYKNNLDKLKEEANDLVKEFTYLDIWTWNERINSIIYSSESLGITATETFEYTNTVWVYTLSKITLS